MTFLDAINVMNGGGFIAHKDWKGSFLWMKPSTSVKSEWCKDPILKMLADANGGEIEASSVICKYNAKTRSIITGWNYPLSDVTSDEWVKVNAEFDGEALIVRVPNKTVDKTVELDLFDGIDMFKKP